MATFYFDGDTLQECPYQPHHRVLSRRMLAHITKCAADPKSPKLEECPFNSLHRVYPEELNDHVMECRDNRQTIRELLNPVAAPPLPVTPQPRTDISDDPWATGTTTGTYVLPGLRDEDQNEGSDNDSNKDSNENEEDDCFISQIKLYNMKPAARKRMYNKRTERVIQKQARAERACMSTEEARELGLDVKPKAEFVIDTKGESSTSGEPSTSEQRNDNEDDESTIPKRRRTSEEPSTDLQVPAKFIKRSPEDEEEDNKEHVKKMIRASEPGCFRTRTVERPYVKRQDR